MESVPTFVSMNHNLGHCWTSTNRVCLHLICPIHESQAKSTIDLIHSEWVCSFHFFRGATNRNSSRAWISFSSWLGLRLFWFSNGRLELYYAFHPFHSVKFELGLWWETASELWSWRMMTLTIYLEMLEMWETVPHCIFLNLFLRVCSSEWMN